MGVNRWNGPRKILPTSLAQSSIVIILNLIMTEVRSKRRSVLPLIFAIKLSHFKNN